MSVAAVTEIVSEQPLLRRHILAVVIGNALEFYDFTTYSFFAVQIGHALFPGGTEFEKLMLSLATFGAGFITRPLGGLVIGAYGDRAGRKPAMLLSFMLMGAAILGMALVPSYAAIGIAAPLIAVGLRLVQGFALGGDVGPTSAYLLEAAPPALRGGYGSLQYMSQGISVLAGGIVGTILASTLSAASLEIWGWRAAFLLGAAVLPFGLIIRSSLPETFHVRAPATEAFASAALPRTSPIREHARTIVLGLLMLASATIATYISFYMTTYASTTLHMAVGISFAATLVLGLSNTIFSVPSGWLSDRIGRRPVMLLPRALLLVVTVPAFALLVAHPGAVALLATTALIASLNTISSTPSFVALAEALPRGMRSGALGSIYALSIAAFGGTTQPAIAWLIHISGAMAPAWYLTGASAVGLVAMLAMKETAPVRLGDAEK